jgi:glycosyltransferase involved in cell wall biosynthesis
VQYLGFNYSNKLLNFGLKFLKYPNLDELIGGADIFFIPNLNFFASTKKCKKIITIHDLSFQLYPHFFSLKRILWHKFIGAKKTISSCDKIIADSQNTKNDLINLFKIEPERIKVISLGVDKEIYKKINSADPKIMEVKNTYALPENFILFLGTIEPRKNIEGLIEAFSLAKAKYSGLKDLYLVIAGEVGWKHKNVFKTAALSQFKDQIKFIGYIPQDDKPALYNLAQTFIFPSFYEGFGLPALEAQACGTPVISASDSSLIEILSDSGFFISPDNISEMALAMNQLISNQNLRQKLIMAGNKNCQHFSWKKCAQETLDYITE